MLYLNNKNCTLNNNNRTFENSTIKNINNGHNDQS